MNRDPSQKGDYLDWYVAPTTSVAPHSLVPLEPREDSNLTKVSRFDGLAMDFAHALNRTGIPRALRFLTQGLGGTLILILYPLIIPTMLMDWLYRGSLPDEVYQMIEEEENDRNQQ